VRLASASVGARGTVALEHGPGLPAGDPHEVCLGNTLREPRMREGVTQLVACSPGMPACRPRRRSIIRSPASMS
jgi:hypothetical protein